MRVLITLPFAAAVVLAQSTVTTYTPDLANGGSIVSATSSSTDHAQTQITQSINGGQVPLEEHQERVISSDSTGSVVETIIRRYDPTGQNPSVSRTVTETRKTPGGGSIVHATTYRSDINGTEQPAERRTVETRVSGNTTNVDTTIDQPGLGGAFQTIEKDQEVTQTAPGKSTSTQSIFRGTPTDGYREAERKVTTVTRTGDQTVQDTTDYEPGTNTGALQVQERRVATTTTTANGDQSTFVNVYTASADGHVQNADDPRQLNQQQIITRVKNPDGSVVETFSVREAGVTDASQLGAAREISRTVCRGNCGAAATPAPGTPLPGATAGAAAQTRP